MSDGIYNHSGYMGDDGNRIDIATGMPMGGNHHGGGWFLDSSGMAFPDTDPMAAAMYGMGPDPGQYFGSRQDYTESRNNPSVTDVSGSTYTQRRHPVTDASPEEILLLLFQ